MVYPASYSFGFLIDKEAEWSVGAEFRAQKWSDYRFFGEADPLRDSWTINAGAQWIPDALRGKNYWSRVAYRVGFFYGLDNIKIDKDASVGIGLWSGISHQKKCLYKSVYGNQYLF